MRDGGGQDCDINWERKRREVIELHIHSYVNTQILVYSHLPLLLSASPLVPQLRLTVRMMRINHVKLMESIKK